MRKMETHCPIFPFFPCKSKTFLESSLFKIYWLSHRIFKKFWVKVMNIPITFQIFIVSLYDFLHCPLSIFRQLLICFLLLRTNSKFPVVYKLNAMGCALFGLVSFIQHDHFGIQSFNYMYQQFSSFFSVS